MSALPITNGDLRPFIIEETSDFNPSTGYLYRASLKGASSALMSQSQQTYAASGMSCRFTIKNNDTSTLEVEDPTQQYAIDIWEVVEENLNVDLFSTRGWLDRIAAYSNGDAINAAIRDALANNYSIYSVGTADWPIINTLNDADLVYMSQLYSLYQRGTTDQRQFNYIVRHTANVPARGWTWASDLVDQNINAIYSNSHLQIELADPSWAYPLPDLLVAKLAKINAAAPADVNEQSASGNTWQWGWLKGGSNATTAANNRINVAQEYVAALWSNTLYGARI